MLVEDLVIYENFLNDKRIRRTSIIAFLAMRYICIVIKFNIY